MVDYITKRLDGVLFSFYNKEELRKLSVVEISNPVAFDNLNKPLKRGLYDPAMGISPYDEHARCITCGQEGLNCPGHLGHIELILPCYNPLVMRYLHRILKSKCFNCHKIRLPQKKIDDFITMLLLIRLGFVNEKYEYEQACSFRPVAKKTLTLKKGASESEAETVGSISTKESKNPSLNPSRKGSETETSSSHGTLNKSGFIDYMTEIEKQKMAAKKKFKRLINIKNNPEFKLSEPNIAMNRALRDCIKDIWSSIMSLKCPHCSSKPPSIKLDSNTKFLIEKKSDKEKISKILHTKKGIENMDDIEEESEEDDEIKDKNNSKLKEKEIIQNYLSAIDIQEHLKLLWMHNKKLLSLIFGNVIVNQNTLNNTKNGYKIISNGWESFFIESLPVPPNRFRPENKMSDQTFLHEHTVLLTKVLQVNQEIKNLILQRKNGKKNDNSDKETKSESGDISSKPFNDMKSSLELTDTIKLWIQLQDAVNSFIDSSKALKTKERESSGIRQLLERKEGLFRMKMMGKRVNYSARSVISPDPYIDTNEVGVPMYVARTLTFPESVNQQNVDRLRKFIINGAQKYPGANYIEENGVKIALETRNEAQRQALAKTLLNNYKNKVVYRHLLSGDVMLFNRQPTLHKSSIMSHIARVLPKENTIRNHYANCNTYNADFDGDEMNLHLLQNHLARAEAYSISITDTQYISTTNGKPLRGLIQDSIISAFFLTFKETFFEKSEYEQLIYAAIWNVLNHAKNTKIIILQPAILKPKRLWTGKQVISSIMKTIVGSFNELLNEEGMGMNLTAKAKVPFDTLTKRKIIEADNDGNIVFDKANLREKIVASESAKQEGEVIIRDNELLQGVIDKNQIGNSEFGLIHSFYEIYGGKMTEILITCLGRLLTNHMQIHAFTCGMGDLIMHQAYDEERVSMIENAHREGVIAAAKYGELENPALSSELNLSNRPSFKIGNSGEYRSHVLKKQPDVHYLSNDNPIMKALEKKLIFTKNGYKELDNQVKGTLNKITTEITKFCVPGGLLKQFPDNLFSVIVLSGAKGSNVNHNQVSCMLGQQELEGRRVPVMASGKTLPSFQPYDPNPRAWGYITDRFLTGVRPQDFYFHCMAGREGLIDTAVKTSVSGYLQRCLMKSMESLIVQYDFTVRDSDGSIVQFYYGEDSLDTTKTKYLKEYEFIENNYNAYVQKYNPGAVHEKLDQKSVQRYLKKRNKQPEIKSAETIMSNFTPGSHFGAVSEELYDTAQKYSEYKLKTKNEALTSKTFLSLILLKYFYSLINPGECVGALAAQAIGEPSTQMTLNTFHLAGHGGANVTLGIPRLREILFKGARKVKTPMMTLKLKSDNKRIIRSVDAELFKTRMEKLKLIELVNSIEVREVPHLVVKKRILLPQERARSYKIYIKFESMDAIKYSYKIDFKHIKEKLTNLFMFNFLAKIAKELKKLAKGGGAEIVAQKVRESATVDAEGIDPLSLLEDNNDDEDDSEIEEGDEAKKKKRTSTKNKKLIKEEAIIDEAKLSSYSQLLDKIVFMEEGDQKGVKIVIKVPLDSKKLLMVNLTEAALSEICMSEIPGINRCHLSKITKNGQEEFQIQTEGINFHAIWNLDYIDEKSIDCNEISSILEIYGVEAARRSIINEIIRVFKPYGINVDYRHISLIADFMTFNGGLKPLTREGISDSVSSLLKMSFEMATRFLADAATYNEYDAMKTPSAQIILGRAPKLGTGLFEVMHDLRFDAKSDDN